MQNTVGLTTPTDALAFRRILRTDANAELRLANNQTIKFHEGATVRLDPNSSVRVIGDIKMPQPSTQQLQIDTTSGSDGLPFTSYTIFKSVQYGSGLVETGWAYDLSDTMRPKFQFCYYRENLDKAWRVGVALVP